MTNSKKIRSKIAFRNALLELLKTNLFDSLTVTQISDKAGYSKQSFYIYYEDKYDFCDKIIDEEVETVKSVVQNAIVARGGHLKTVEDIRYMRTQVFSHIYDNKELYYAFFKQPCFSNFVRKFMKYLLEDEQLPIFLFSYKDHENVNVMYLNYICSYIHIAHLNYWVETNFRSSPEKMGETYSRLMEDLDFITFEDIGTTYIKQKNLFDYDI